MSLKLLDTQAVGEAVGRHLFFVGERILESSKPVGKMSLQFIDEKGNVFGEWTQGVVADVVEKILKRAIVDAGGNIGPRVDTFAGRLGEPQRSPDRRVDELPQGDVEAAGDRREG